MGVGTKKPTPYYYVIVRLCTQGTKNPETDHAFSVTLELVHLYTHRKKSLSIILCKLLQINSFFLFHILNILYRKAL